MRNMEKRKSIFKKSSSFIINKIKKNRLTEFLEFNNNKKWF